MIKIERAIRAMDLRVKPHSGGFRLLRFFLAAILSSLVSWPAQADIPGRIGPAADAARASLSAASATLEQDNYDDGQTVGTFEWVSGNRPDSVMNSLATFNQLSAAYLAQISRLSGASINTLADPSAVAAQIQQATSDEIELRGIQAALISRFRGFFVKILASDYGSANDPEYQAAKAKLLAEMTALRDQIGSYATSLSSLNTAISALLVEPNLAIEILSITSMASKSDRLAFITEHSETFQVVARFKNYSAQPVTAISARLSASAPTSSVIVEYPEQPVGDGSLAADDGLDGQGDDEKQVSWTLTYVGQLEDETVFLEIELLEAAGAPVSFSANRPTSELLVDPLLLDADRDHMPDRWETAHGLDVGADDSSNDDDRDGLTNLQELRLGTDPRNKDSDGDGLSDGVEVDGANGTSTDPLNPDTDGDGASDKSDGQPLDGGSTARNGGLGEPAVAVDKIEVVLSNEAPNASIEVTNAGAGVLTWFVEIDNDAAASLTPERRILTAGDGVIGIGPPVAGFDYSASAGLITTLRVYDAYGSKKDFREIAICHLSCTPPPPIDVALEKVHAQKGAKCVNGPFDVSVVVKNDGGGDVPGVDIALSGSVGSAEVYSQTLSGQTLLASAKRGLTTFVFSFDPTAWGGVTVAWTATVTAQGDISAGNDSAGASTKITGSCTL